MKTLIVIAVIFCAGVAHAQIPTCVVAIKASPMGPFPCSVLVQWADNSGNDPKVNDQETGMILERRLNGSPWATIGGILPANTTSAIDATLQQSTTTINVYDYKVSATNSAGTASGVTPIMASFSIPQALQPPKPPSNITVTFNNATGRLDLQQGKTTNLKDDTGVFEITASDITIDYK